MKARIQWTGEAGFEGSADSGHKVTMDGPPEYGGKNRGSRPMELVLIGMGGCTAFDVVHILKKSRQDITDCVAEIDAERAATARSPSARFASARRWTTSRRSAARVTSARTSRPALIFSRRKQGVCATK